jgi:hypothetical protein
LDTSTLDNTGVFGGNLKWTEECAAKNVTNPKKENPAGCKISTGEYIYSFPMVSTTMEIKTTSFNQNTLKNLDKLKQAMKKDSPAGFCGMKAVEGMTQVSNRKLCGGNQGRNIGFYYRTTFPVGTNGLKYSFKMPSDFGHGGIVYLDGKIMKEYSKDIWQGGKSTMLDFEAELASGMHVLEIWGAEGCCDGVTAWSFSVNGDKYLAWTVENFNKFWSRKTVEFNLCKRMTGWDKECRQASGWHYSIKKDQYAEQNVCTVLVKTNNKMTCADYCKTQNLQCYYA